MYVCFMNMIRFNMKMLATLHKDLKRAARQEGLTVSAFVRRLIIERIYPKKK